MNRFYTLKEQIPQILEERKKDEKLIREIKNFYFSEIGVEPPREIEGSYCVLARQLLTNTRETIYAKTFATLQDSNLLIPTYVKDRFVTTNKEKLSYLKPHFDGEERPTKLINGKRMSELDRIRTNLDEIVLDNGETLINFHNEIVRKCHYSQIFTFENSKFLNKKKAKQYYPAFLAMFGGLNCLLEDFHYEKEGKSLKAFVSDIFEPAFEKVEKELGFKPIIYRLPDLDNFDKYVKCPLKTREIFEEYTQLIKNG